MKTGASATSKTAVIGIKLSNMLETLRTVGGSAWLRYRVIPFRAEQPKVCENPHPSGVVRDAQWLGVAVWVRSTIASDPSPIVRRS